MVGLLQLPSQLEQRLRAMTRLRTIGYRSALCGGLAAVVAVSAAFVAPVPSLQLPDNIGTEPAAATRMGAIDAARIGRMGDTVPKQPRRADSLTAAERDSLAVLVSEKEARTAAVRTARARVDSTQTELYKRRFELDVAKGRVSAGGANSARVESAYVARRGASPSTANSNMTYFDYQVEKPAQTAPNSPSPTYPASLRSKGIEGEVGVEFVVDKTGSVESGSAHVVKSTNPLFTSAVLDVLPQMRFVPAEIGGVRVRQLVHQPFTFVTTHK
jgi:TonB family protein